MSVENDDSLPAPSWLQKLEDQRAHRLKARLGHEVGAGALCQTCDKCPGLDLHFWRKICKLCKCGKEDHDITDEDIYGFVQFQLLGSKPVKTKGIVLKGQKDEVTLEWTPKGSSTDVKKYLDELPVDLVPIKGSEAAKLRKQRLQKQMPAHDIDASLCHALTEDEIKELEEYVAHIRKHSVGQGKIIRLPLLKGFEHKLTTPNAQILSQLNPAQIASSQTVFLQASNLTNNLEKLSLRDQIPTIPNFVPNLINNQTIDDQNPLINKIKDINYPYNETENLVHYPLTTSNVEKHQEQFENPNFRVNNGNFERVLTNPSLNFNPSFVKPIEQHQFPTQVGQIKDLKATNPSLQYNPNYINAIEQNQLPVQVGQIRDVTYPVINNANIDKIPSLQPHYNPSYLSSPLEQNQLPTQVGQPKDLKYPTNYQGSNSSLAGPGNQIPNIIQGGQPTNLIYPAGNTNLNHGGQPTDLKYPSANQGQTSNLNFPGNQNQGGQPSNLIYPVNNNANLNKSSNQVPNQVSQPTVLKYPTSNIGGQNSKDLKYPGDNNIPLDNKLSNILPYSGNNSNLERSGTNFQGGLSKDLKYPGDNNIPLDNKLSNILPYSGNNSNIDRSGANFQGGPSMDLKYPGDNNVASNIPLDMNLSNILPYSGNNSGANNVSSLSDNQVPLDPQFRPQLPIFEAQNVINPFEIPLGSGPDSSQDLLNSNKSKLPNFQPQNAINPLSSAQNLTSVGLIQDILPELPGSNPQDLLNANTKLIVTSCHECKDAFQDGAIAVSAERTNNLWHPKCFICHTCQQPLADLLYFFHKDSDNIYCGRDFAILKGIPRCSACDELIFVREYCLAEDKNFHVKHFCCFECDMPLAGQRYLMENNQPFCVACYENVKAEGCQDCGTKIGPEEQGVSLQDMHWHARPSCFACKLCRKSLLGNKLLLRNGNLFCSDICYKKY